MFSHSQLQKITYSYLFALLLIIFASYAKHFTHIMTEDVGFNQAIKSSMQNEVDLSDVFDDAGSGGKDRGQLSNVYKREVTGLKEERSLEQYALKGDGLICKMRDKDETGLYASVWTSYRALERWGWQKDPNYDPLARDQFGDGWNGFEYNAANFKFVEWDQLDEVKDAGGNEILPSAGLYGEIYDVQDGIIVADTNWGPRYMMDVEKKMPKQPIVPLNNWADVVFLEWKNLAGDKVDNLKYVFRVNVQNGDTLATIYRALAAASPSRQIGQWDDRTIFLTSNTLGQAILATPNIRGVAWLLITHKSYLGDTTSINSITVWEQPQDYDPDEEEDPCAPQDAQGFGPVSPCLWMCAAIGPAGGNNVCGPADASKIAHPSQNQGSN